MSKSGVTRLGNTVCSDKLLSIYHDAQGKGTGRFPEHLILPEKWKYSQWPLPTDSPQQTKAKQSWPFLTSQRVRHSKTYFWCCSHKRGVRCLVMGVFVTGKREEQDDLHLS